MKLQTRQIYVLLFTLYWAQGLPVGFMTHALPVILRAQGVSLTHIGGFGLLMAPWAFKFLWAPYLDRRGYQDLGYYRSCVLAMQGMTVAVLLLLSFLPIASLNHPIYLLLFFIALLSMNIVGATQDIATDAIAVNVLQPKQQHWGNLFQVIGSRLGFIVGGGLILWLMDLLHWQSTFILLAVLVALNSLPMWRTVFTPLTKQYLEIDKRPLPVDLISHHTTQHGLYNYFSYFTQRPELRYWVFILLTVKVTDGLSGPVLKPLMVDIGLSLSQIGIYITMLGAGAALLGASFAAWCLQWLQRPQALLLFSVLKLMSLLAFTWIAYQYEQGAVYTAWVIYLINALEDMFAAMLLLVMLTLVMQYSRQSHAGTDFSFQVAVMALVSGGLYSLGGVFADVFGYSTYLLILIVLGSILLLPILLWKRHYQAL